MSNTAWNDHLSNILLGIALVSQPVIVLAYIAWVVVSIRHYVHLEQEHPLTEPQLLALGVLILIFGDMLYACLLSGIGALLSR